MSAVGIDTVKENTLLSSAMALMTKKGFCRVNTSAYFQPQENLLVFADAEMIEVSLSVDEESDLVRVDIVLPIIPQRPDKFISFCGFHMNDGLLHRNFSLSEDRIENLNSEIDEAHLALRGIEAGFRDDLMTLRQHNAGGKALIESMLIGATTGGVCALIAAALCDLGLNGKSFPQSIEEVKGWLGFAITGALAGTLLQAEIDNRAGKFDVSRRDSHDDLDL